MESCIKTGFGEYYLVNEALTDIALDDIDTTCEFLGKRISTPFVISPITGGIKIARTINQNLAKAAQELNIAMSVGSEKLALEDPSLISTY